MGKGGEPNGSRKVVLRQPLAPYGECRRDRRLEEESQRVGDRGLFLITRAAPAFPFRGGQRQAVNVTDGGCCATITTRYEAICCSNILTLAHYPMTVILMEL